MFQNRSKRARRRVFPIHAYTGPNGGGKSAAMVWDTLPSLERGRPVLSTVRLLDYLNPRECEGCEDPMHLRPIYAPVAPEAQLELEEREVIGEVVHKQAHRLWVPFTEWPQLLDAAGCDVLLDEVTGVASSRESAGLPAPVANKLVQLRRADVVVRWSAPSWKRADLIIRECSQMVTWCQGYLPKRSSDGDREWRNRRLFRWKSYDAADFEDFTAGKREQLRALVVDHHWGPRSPAFLAYDTFDAVSTIGTVSDSGRCYTCAGRRTLPDCSCSDYVGRKLDAKDAAARAARARPQAEHAGPIPIPAPSLRRVPVLTDA
jgi:hypothetical protein